MNYKRSLVILVENQDKYDAYTRKDMTRWWRGHCKHHQRDGELYIEVTYPIRSNIYEGIKRLASFGVKARAALRRT